jgi:hypothetical protein
MLRGPAQKQLVFVEELQTHGSHKYRTFANLTHHRLSMIVYIWNQGRTFVFWRPVANKTRQPPLTVINDVFKQSQ